MNPQAYPIMVRKKPNGKQAVYADSHNSLKRYSVLHCRDRHYYLQEFVAGYPASRVTRTTKE